LTKQGSLQSRKHRHVLFAQGGHVAANAGKGLRSDTGSEPAGHLLLERDQTQITLSVIVAQRHAQTIQ